MRLPISSWGIWKTARFVRRRPKRQVPRPRTRQLAREQLEDRTLLATVSLGAYGGMQEGYSASIAVYRDDSAGDLTESFFTSDYTAEPGDYQLYDNNFQPLTSSLTFYDGQSSTSLWIYAPIDADGDDESFAIQLSDTGQYMVDSYNSSAFVEIWDSSGSSSGVTPTVWLELDLTISEGNSGNLVFRRDTFEGDLTVDFQAINVTAEAGDFGLMSNSVTFYSGSDSVSVSLWTMDDADGDDELIQIDLLGGGGAYFIGNGATVTIEDFEPPVATDNVYATLEDNVLAGNLLTDNTGAGVDFDPNGGLVTLSTFAAWGPYSGSLTLAADGTFTYQPNADFNGMDSFGYTIFDEDAQSGSATATIGVDPDNDPPVASGGYTIYVNEDSFTSSMVSAWDIDGDTLTYGVPPGGHPAHGTLDLNEWGSFSYTPFENYHGSDSFTFQVADPTGPPVTAEIMITVDPVNDAPIAGDDIAVTDENQSIALSDLLANDTDLHGDSLMVASFDSSTFEGGGVSDNGNGTLFYQPPTGFVGTDTFTYTASDGHGGYASATVTVSVLQQPEVWMDAPASLMENGTGEFTLHRNRSEGELTVTLTGYDNTSEPGDYALPGSVTFAEGITSLPVLFQAHDDADPDDELFYPAISDAGSYAIGGMSCALVTILDDDPQNVWFDSSSATIIEPSSSGFSSSVELTLTRNTSEGELTVLYHVAGTAEAGDYTISPGNSVTFYDGQSSTTLWITAEDDDDGDDETLSIEVLAADNAVYSAGATFWIMMVDDDTPANDDPDSDSDDSTASDGLLVDGVVVKMDDDVYKELATNDVRKEIVNTMILSEHTYSYSKAELAIEIAYREEVIKQARDVFAGYIKSGKLVFASAFGEDQDNPIVTPALAPNGRASTLVNQLKNARKIETECRIAAEMTYLFALREYLGLAKFNDYYDMLKLPANGSHDLLPFPYLNGRFETVPGEPQRKEDGTTNFRKDIIPGDYLNFLNPGADMPWHNENVIYLGQGEYFAHPFGIVTEQKLKDALADAFGSQGKTGEPHPHIGVVRYMVVDIHPVLRDVEGLQQP